MLDLVDIGSRVRATRKAKRLTQVQLAEKSGVSRARIEALENARIAEIGIKHLLRILRALDLDLRVTEFNRSRPTLEDLIDEETRQDAPRLDR